MNGFDKKMNRLLREGKSFDEILVAFGLDPSSLDGQPCIIHQQHSGHGVGNSVEGLASSISNQLFFPSRRQTLGGAKQ